MAEQRQLQKLTRDDVTKHNKDSDLVRNLPLSFPFQIVTNFTPPISVGNH